MMDARDRDLHDVAWFCRELAMTPNNFREWCRRHGIKSRTPGRRIRLYVADVLVHRREPSVHAVVTPGWGEQEGLRIVYGGRP